MVVIKGIIHPKMKIVIIYSHFTPNLYVFVFEWYTKGEMLNNVLVTLIHAISSHSIRTSWIEVIIH